VAKQFQKQKLPLVSGPVSVFKRVGNRFRVDSSGQFAVWMALLAVPVLGATTFVMDYQQAKNVTTELESALDAAVLAAVTDGTLSESEREKHAIKVFHENYTGTVSIKLEADATDTGVELTAYGEVPTTISSMTGVDHIKIKETSAAEITKENIVCLMTLDPSGSYSLDFGGGAVFDSPNCAVHVNSSHKYALSSTAANSPVASDFCVHGGAYGKFSPYVNTQCSQIADPYSNITPPSPGPCKTLIRPPGAKAVPGYMSSSVVVDDDVVLTPGTYCNGLTFIGKNITLKPGVYLVEDGPLTFMSATQVNADDVTIVLAGSGANMEVKQGADAVVHASRSGPYAGLAFYQVPKGGGALPEATSYLYGGGNLEVTGTLYFPTQKVDVTGKSEMSAKAKATSIIAYKISFYGKVKARFDVNHTVTGLPPLLPRSDEGARLVR